MPHKKGHDPQIKKAPSKFTSLVRNIKASPQAPYPFIRSALVGAAILSPSPLGKGKMVKNMASFAKQAKKVPPISKNPYLHTTKQYLKNNKNPYANTTKQYIQSIVDSRLKSRIGQAEAVSGRQVPVIGKLGQTVKVNNPKTKAVSYVNPRISMTAAERAKAGY